MRIIIDIGHPSFVHLFKSVAKRLVDAQHSVLFSYRDKDSTLELLKALDLPYVYVGKNYASTFGKFLGLVVNTFKLFKLTQKFKPNLILSGASPYASMVSGMSKTPHFVFDDTENKEQILFYKLGSKLIITPQSFSISLGKRHIKYPGIHELAYLPSNIFRKKCLEPKKQVFLRFVSWNASHDTFRKGFTDKQKIALVNRLKNDYKLIISSEPELPDELKTYAFTGRVEDIHNTLAKSSLYVGESATMAAEAACLNVPALFFYSKPISYIKWLENSYGLVKWYDFSESSLSNAWLEMETVLQSNEKKQGYNEFLNSTIDLTCFMFWLVQNFKTPNLHQTIKHNDFFKAFMQ